MSDRAVATEPTTQPAPNPHDVAMAVFRPEVYGEAADWLQQVHGRELGDLPGFAAAVDKLNDRRAQAATAPGAGQLDHATAAYYRHAAVSLRRAGYDGAARLLEHVADDFDGGDQ